MTSPDPADFRVGLTIPLLLAMVVVVAFVLAVVALASPATPSPTARTGAIPERALPVSATLPVTAEEVAIGSVLIAGEASYFDDGPGLYGAVHSYRWGDPTYPAVVCRADDATRCVTVTVRDHMAHPTRAIDLSPEAFSRLAPLSDGVLQVTVTYGGRELAGPTLPPTSTVEETKP